MAQLGKGKLNYRCPSCFLRDLDIDMFYNKETGFFYWEPAWIPVSGSGWATEASLKYMNDKGPCGNEWANQALFDYDGNALPTWNLIRDFKPENE